MSGWYDYRGVIHCHSTYSDGTGDFEEISRCANEVGLDFVMMTDHDTMKPVQDGHEGWRGSTLMICGTEITPSVNHYIVFGEGVLKDVEKIKRGKPQEIIQAVRDQGWFGFIAHPDHKGTKRFEIPSYAWQDWSVEGFQGMGLWDLMTDWQSQLDRDNLTFKVYTDFAHALTGPCEETLDRWDALCRKRKIVGIGEIDNHKYIKEWEGQRLEIFPYELAFRTIVNHVLLDKPLDKDFNVAKRQVFESLKYGRCYVSFDFWDDPTDFSFEIDNGKKVAFMGDETSLNGQGEVVVSLPQKALINIVCNGEVIHEEENDEALAEITEPGIYRIEAMRNNLTWILSNPIYVTV